MDGLDGTTRPWNGGLYVHIPFCHSECTYCDFYRVSYRDRAGDDFLSALDLELQTLPSRLHPRTVYIGGGTPSSLREPQLERLLGMLAPFTAGACEFTCEVNPRSATEAKIELLARAGVSRVSFGAQTFDAEALRLLGRRHGPEDISRVHRLLRRKIRSISFDLIFALPGQSLESWARDLRLALELEPDHLSLYSLIYEPETPLTRAVERGEQVPVPDEREREMLLLAVRCAAAAGLHRYEVSSYARPGHESAHNRAYWLQHDYIGVGPGACTTLGALRYTNIRSLDAYVQGLLSAGLPPRQEERLSRVDQVNEMILLRLRMAEGLPLAEFEARAGTSLDSYSGGSVASLLQGGFLSVEQGAVRLTEAGLCVADEVISQLLAQERPDIVRFSGDGT
jgi:oxygen-independent coproporphyrinogen-3 oxidase